MHHDRTPGREHQRELGRALTNGLAGWLALLTVVWIRHWAGTPAGPILTAPWILAALAVTTLVVFARNLAQSRTHLAFAALRSAAHLLFGLGAPATVVFLAVLGGFDEMSAPPRIGLLVLALSTAAALGYGLIRFVIVPGDPTKTPPPRPRAGA